MADAKDFQDRMLSLGLARVSEAAALASARLVGRGDEKAADQAAVNAMRDQLNMLDIAGVVVIGEGERDEAPMLFIGEKVGMGKGPKIDIALDPLEGTTITAIERVGTDATQDFGGDLTGGATFDVKVRANLRTGDKVQLVRLDADGTPLLARITRFSRDQLQLHPGQRLWAQIKAVAVLA